MTLDEMKKDVLSRLPDEKGLKEWNILLAFRGSVAHNCYVPNLDHNSIDDIDLMGICIPPLDYYFGLKEYGSRGTVEIKHGNLDIVVYEFKKLINMLSGCNPNVLSLLFLEPDFYLSYNEVGGYLVTARKYFLSKEVYHSFGGYAANQLKEMKKDSFRGYMGEKRKKLVEKFGYDTKNASHLIRLLRMCREILVDENLNVYRRDDREELLAIKTGQWSYEQVMAESDKLFQLCEEAYAISKLPEKCDTQIINEICVEALKMALIKERE